MEKTFTVNVPDELWVDSWNTNKTETYTYIGPSSIKVLIETTDEWEFLDWSETDFEREIQEHEIVVDLEVTDETVAVAHWIVSKNNEYEYTYETITNHDNSTYEQISNPRIQDYFDIRYRPSSKFFLDTIYKDHETQNEKIAKERKEYVEKYKNAYDFDEATQTKINEFITAVNSYLDTMVTAYPWKYITIDKNEIPKIPAVLISVFNELPEIV